MFWRFVLVIALLGWLTGPINPMCAEWHKNHMGLCPLHGALTGLCSVLWFILRERKVAHEGASDSSSRAR